MVLADRELKEIITSGHLRMEHYDERLVEAATYDMRIGQEAFIVSSGGPERLDLQQRRILTIGASELAIVGTHETLRMPPDVVGHFGLKSSLSRKGLYASTGPQIDPGWNGRIFVSLFNLAPAPIAISYLETFLTVEFVRLPRAVETPYHGVNQGKYHLTADDVQPFLNAQVPTLAKIHHEFGEMSSNLRAVAGLTERFDTFLADYRHEREEYNKSTARLLGEIKRLVDYILDGGDRAKAVVLRKISRKRAKKEIVELFQSGETLYYSDIAQRLGLDLRLVVELCNELEREGVIGVGHAKKGPQGRR